MAPGLPDMSWKPLDVDVYTPPQKQVDIGAESNPQPVPVAELQRIIAATAADEAEQQVCHV